MKRIVFLYNNSGDAVYRMSEKVVDDIQPIDRITAGLVYSTPERAEAAVIAGYDGLQSAEFLSGRTLIYADLLSDDVIDKNSFFR
jgi:hypothetical protein